MKKLTVGDHKDFEIRLGTNKKVSFFGGTPSQLLKKIASVLFLGKKSYLVTPNSEFLVKMEKDPIFLGIITKADFIIPDGIGVIWAKNYQLKTSGGFSPCLIKKIVWAFIVWLKVLKGDFFKQRITGVDLMADLCQLAKEKKWLVFFLGGQEGVAKKTGEKLLGRKTRGTLWEAFAGDGSEDGDKETVAAIKGAAKKMGGKIALLFVAYGMEKQEKWIVRNLKKIPVILAMGVGGSFDYFAGAVPRAPSQWQKIGLEWLWRLLHQPWRIKRQWALLKFICLMLKA